MSKRAMLGCLFAGLLAVPTFAQSGTQRVKGGDGDPRVPGLRCLHRMGHLTADTARLIRQTSHRCAVAINRLQEEGREEEAALLGEECAQRVERIAEAGSQRVNTLSENCIERMTEAGAPADLIDAVQKATQSALEVIANHLERALALIDEALMPNEPSDG